MPSTYPRVLRLLTILVIASVVWMLLESVRLTQSHQIVAPGTPRETLVLLPSRSIMALYVFLIVVTLIPPTSIAALVWLPGGKSRFRPADTMKTPARVLYTGSARQCRKRYLDKPRRRPVPHKGEKAFG